MAFALLKLLHVSDATFLSHIARPVGGAAPGRSAHSPRITPPSNRVQFWSSAAHDGDKYGVERGHAVVEWERIVGEHGPAAFRAAWRVLGHASDAEDATQDALLDAWKLFRRRPIANWAGLLRHLAVRRALDRLRARRKVVPLPTAVAAPEGDGPDLHAEAGELEARFREALAELAPREAEVFGMTCFGDLEPAAIAEALGISANAVAASLAKARRRLRSILQPEDES